MIKYGMEYCNLLSFIAYHPSSLWKSAKKEEYLMSNLYKENIKLQYIILNIFVTFTLSDIVYIQCSKNRPWYFGK